MFAPRRPRTHKHRPSHPRASALAPTGIDTRTREYRPSHRQTSTLAPTSIDPAPRASGSHRHASSLAPASVGPAPTSLDPRTTSMPRTGSVELAPTRLEPRTTSIAPAPGALSSHRHASSLGTRTGEHGERPGKSRASSSHHAPLRSRSARSACRSVASAPTAAPARRHPG